MKYFFPILLLVFSLRSSVFGLVFVSYVEKHNGMERNLTARVGKEIFLGQFHGTFPSDLKTNPPWYLTGLPSMEKETQIVLEGLPPLILRREFRCHPRENGDPGIPAGACPVPRHGAGMTNCIYQVVLTLSAKQESLPLGEEEAKMNTLLKPYGVEEIFLEGTGRQWLESEEFLLKGFVVKEGKKEPLEISWARGEWVW